MLTVTTQASKRSLQMPVMFRHNQYHFVRELENRQKHVPLTTSTTTTTEAPTYSPSASRLPALVGLFQDYFRKQIEEASQRPAQLKPSIRPRIERKSVMFFVPVR